MTLSDKHIKFIEGFKKPLIRYSEEDLKVSIRELKRLTWNKTGNIDCSVDCLHRIIDEEMGERLT